jgi:hypothetical protein
MTNQDTPGTDWAAKHAAAGQNAQPANDRPHRIDPTTTHTVSNDDVITHPTGSDDVITVYTGKIVNR